MLHPFFISHPSSHHAVFRRLCCDNYSIREGVLAFPRPVEENTMEYEFLRDVTGLVKVRMSMGHEVVGHWFNEEVKEDRKSVV